MKVARRPRILGAVLMILSLPVVLAVTETVAFRVANRSNGTLLSSGEEREYLLFVPETYHKSRPTALVISLHGAGGWPASQQQISQWDEVAEREGFIVVYPSGLKGHGPRIWRADADNDQALDVRFIADLIDTISATYSIDRARIYANGFSNGGGMSFVLSCTLYDRIAAVGLVDAAHLQPWGECAHQPPVPMISFHGTSQHAAPYHGGKSWVTAKPFPSIPRWTATWARRNGCAEDPVETVVASDVVRMEYPNCVGNARVILYRIEGGGHTWPGGGQLPEWFVGTTSQSIDASAEMWKFFREHPLRLGACRIAVGGEVTPCDRMDEAAPGLRPHPTMPDDQ